MKRFIMLSSTCRIIGTWKHTPKREVKEWVCEAIERYQCCKVMAAAGGIGLS